MANNIKNIWTKDNISKAIGMSILLFLLLNILFIEYRTPAGLFILTAIVTVLFFYSLRRFLIELMDLPYKVFIKKIFIRSIVIRLLFLGIVVVYTIIYNPGNLEMLEMFSADAWNYNFWGAELSKNLFNGQLLKTLETLFRESADWGFSLYIGIVYYLFSDSVIAIKILNILWGSLTAVYVSKTAYMLYSERHAKLTGIIMMIMPSLIWFNTLLLKESLMIFIITIIFYNAIKIIKVRLRYSSIITIVLLTTSLFYFRTVLATVVIISLAIYFLLNFIYDRQNKYFSILSLILFSVFIIYLSRTTGQIESVETGYGKLKEENTVETYLSEKVSRLEEGFNVKTSIVAPLMLLSSFVTPYPTFLNLDERQISIISHSQNELTRIIIIYFALAAIPFLIRKDLKNSSLLLSFVLGYITILALTANSYEDRFQLPALPFLIIFISVGLINLSKKVKNYWNIYLILMFIAIFLWHIFKLSIRGVL